MTLPRVKTLLPVFTVLLILCLVAVARWPKKESFVNPLEKPSFQEGDVIASNGTPNVKVVKVLKIETFRLEPPQDPHVVFHVLMYGGQFTSVDDARLAYQRGELRPFVMHAPVDGKSFVAPSYLLLAHEEVTAADLVGYRAYTQMRGE